MTPMTQGSAMSIDGIGDNKHMKQSGEGLEAKLRRSRTTPLQRRLRTLLVICLLLLLGAATVVARSSVERTADQRWQREQRMRSALPTTQDLELASHLMPITLRELLHRGQADKVLQLLRRVSPEVRAAAVDYEVAALVETGDFHRARTLWQGTATDHTSPFRHRIERGLAAADNGLQAALFDRRGVPIAYRGVGGRIRLDQDVDPRLIPKQSLATLPELGGVRLTLDLGLSRQLLSAIDRQSRDRVEGGIVVLDATDGAVLAAVGKDETGGTLGHDFLLSTREPASIAKLMTTSATLRAGWNPNAEIRRIRCTGGLRLSGTPLYCSTVGGRLEGLDEALATSCNVAFAHLGHRLGPSRIIDEYRRFGFAAFASKENSLYGHLLNLHPTDRELGDLAIGLNQVEITPLHAAVLARTMVDGYLITPHQLIAQDGLLGLSPRLADSEILAKNRLTGLQAPAEYLSGEKPVLNPAWLPTLHSAMEAVADPGGTAYDVEPGGFGVAMKTGTGSDPATGFHINYIGYAPADNPRFAFALRLTHGRTSKQIRQQAIAVTRDILRILAEREEASKTKDMTVTWRAHEPAVPPLPTGADDQPTLAAASG